MGKHPTHRMRMEAQGFTPSAAEMNHIRMVTHCNNYRSRIDGKGQRVEAYEWGAILMSSQGLCHWCHADIGVLLLTMDHVVALNEGGDHLPHNLVAACKQCNSSRGMKGNWRTGKIDNNQIRIREGRQLHGKEKHDQ